MKTILSLSLLLMCAPAPAALLFSDEFNATPTNYTFEHWWSDCARRRLADNSAGGVTYNLSGPTQWFAHWPALNTTTLLRRIVMPESQTTARVEYRPIAGFTGYRIGNDGSCWSRRKIGRTRGELRDEWRPRKATPVKDGYLQLQVVADDGSMKCLAVSRQVLEAFVGPPPAANFEAAHRNGIVTDNRVENLYWATPLENTGDKIRHGTWAHGEGAGNVKLKAGQIPEIRSRYAEGESLASIGRSLGVSYVTIHGVVNRKTWKHVKEAL